MSRYTAAVIGTGPDPETQTVESFAMGYRHAEAYRRHDDIEVVACADVVPENAEAFADEFDCAAYEDYEEMLADAAPDVVSVTVPPAIHEDIIVGCARSGVVDAIHAEKPIADTWGGAKNAVQECWRNDVQLTFNRQRRFLKPFTEAKRLLDAGEVGELRQVEITWGDFFDTGAHTIDLAGMFNDDRPAEWIIAQLDYREEDVRFGMHQENQMLAQWRYENGVHGTLTTGAGADLHDSAFRVRGTEGDILIDVEDGPMLAVERGGERDAIDVEGETIHSTPEDERFHSVPIERAVADAIACLGTDEESGLSGRIGLNTAEIVFGGYESVRRRGRVDFPLDVEDNAFAAMVEEGVVGPDADAE
ncbi:Gfo/Idh/MocA family protein [Halarchaeum sp. P4]|uniref:Gfo/Idh/MocA family protein n=1 Tax=Halarchaeum sp. P4 TaxID=3421639 RepID=UPI003EBFB679